MDPLSAIIDTDDADWLQNEVFDFDNGTGLVKSPVSNDDGAFDEDDVEDEIFIGPVTHFERCAIKAVERLTPSSVSENSRPLLEKNKDSTPVLYSISKYSYKANSPVAVVHPICKEDHKAIKEENKENKETICLSQENKNKAKKETEEKKEIQKPSNSIGIPKKTKPSKLKVPGIMPSLLPAPGKLKLVPPKSSGIKPPKPLCTSGSSSMVSSSQTASAATTRAEGRTKLTTPKPTSGIPKIPVSGNKREKSSNCAQIGTPSRRRSVSGAPRRPTSGIPKAGAATPRSESASNAMVPRSLLKREGTPSTTEKEKRSASRPLPRSRVRKTSASQLNQPSANSTADDPIAEVYKHNSARETQKEAEVISVVSSPEEKPKTKPGVSSDSDTTTDSAESTNSECSVDAKQPNCVVTIDDVFAMSDEGPSLSQPLIGASQTLSPSESLLLDINDASSNSPLIKFSPPLASGPFDPFKTGSTPVQQSMETEVLLPALADENPTNVDLIQF